MEKRSVACEDNGSEERVGAMRQSECREELCSQSEQKRRERGGMCRRQQQRTADKQTNRCTYREITTAVMCASRSSVQKCRRKAARVWSVGIGEVCVWT